ncbi:MAG: hypothetical protein ABIT04_13370 [Novosphingobium sp.]
MDSMRRPRFAPGPAICAALLLLLAAIIVAYAWIDGGAERVHDIAQPVMPERAR